MRRENNIKSNESLETKLRAQKHGEKVNPSPQHMPQQHISHNMHKDRN